MINKRYKDIFLEYIHRGEATPLTIGSLVVCGFCFLILIIATFTQINFFHPWFGYISNIEDPSMHQGFTYATKYVSYSPLMPAMIFIIYILGKQYSTLLYIMYLITGFFIWPIFVFGGGVDYIQNYLFGFVLSFIIAIFITGSILNIGQNIKCRVIAALLGVLSMHIFGFLYCIILAIFKVISFSLVGPILKEITLGNIVYDIIFSVLIILVAPYIKNIFWICMKPKMDKPKKLKKY